MLKLSASRPNDHKKEGFTMRSVAFKALAVGLVLVTASAIGGSLSPKDGTVQAQQGQRMLSAPWSITDARTDSERGRNDNPRPAVRAEASATPSGGSSVVHVDTYRVLAKENRARANTVVVLGGIFTPWHAGGYGVYRFTFRYNYNGTVRIANGGNYRFAALAALTAAVGDISSATETLFFRGNRGDIGNELIQVSIGLIGEVASAILASGNVIDAVKQALQRTFQLFDSQRTEEVLCCTRQIQFSATLPAGQPIPVFTTFQSGVSVKASRLSVASATVEMPQLQLLDVLVEFMGPGNPPREQPPQGICKTNPPGQLAVYRLFHVGWIDHFYTTDCQEAKNAVQQLGFVFEGVPFSVFIAGTSATTPFFRLFNPRIQDHFYTADPAERDWAVARGWQLEGTLGNIATQQLSGTLPLYRLWNGSDHMYTTDWNEVLSAQRCCGYVYEGIAGYVAPPPS